MDSIKNDSKELFQGVQVKPFDFGGGKIEYKYQAIGFEVVDDLKSAKGMTNANPHLGKGGLEQIFTPDFKNLVREGKLKPILDSDTMKQLEKLGITFEPKLLQKVDENGKYVYKSICETMEVIAKDMNVVELDNFKVDQFDFDKIEKIIENIENAGGGIR